MDIQKGVPQGSILGHSLFNLLMNDIFNVVTHSILSNYADDNSVLITAKTDIELKQKIVQQGSELIDWCDYNQMEANPSKFELFIANENEKSHIQICDTNISSSDTAKLLGVTLDNRLTFSQHIASLITKSCRQLNCLKKAVTVSRYQKQTLHLQVLHFIKL